MRIFLIGVVAVLAGCSTGHTSDGVTKAQFDALAARVAAVEGEVPLIRGEVSAQGEIVKFANYRVSVPAEKSLAPVFPVQRLVQFQSADCTGQAYVDSATGLSAYGARQGAVFTDGRGAPLYIAAGTVAEPVTIASVISTIDGSCATHATPVAVDAAFKALANDEAITCMPDTGFTGAIGRVGQYISSQSNAQFLEILTCTDYIAMLDAVSVPLIVGN